MSLRKQVSSLVLSCCLSLFATSQDAGGLLRQPSHPFSRQKEFKSVKSHISCVCPLFCFQESYLGLYIRNTLWGAWVAQLGGADFGSGHDLAVHEFEPCVGLCAWSLEPALDSVSPSLSACLPLVLLLSPPQKINK